MLVPSSIFDTMPGPPGWGANHTPSGLWRRLLWHIEGRRRVQARVLFTPARRLGRVEGRDLQRVRAVRGVQAGRDLQGRDAPGLHVGLGVVAGATQIAQVLATRETHNSR